MKRLDVIYEDNSCIVINKPAGLAVQGGKGVGVSLDSILTQTLPQRPLLVHRLDKDTSGLVLVAKTKASAAEFSRLLRGEGAVDDGTVDGGGGGVADGGGGGGVADGVTDGGTAGGVTDGGVIKRYLAVCKGRPAQPEGIIKADLAIHGAVKKSETRYRLISDRGEFSLVELELGTGRMHQIRRHLALLGNPVLGDDKYGDFDLNHKLRKTMKLRHLLLHASRLIIPQTPDGVRLDLTAPLPDYFPLG